MYFTTQRDGARAYPAAQVASDVPPHGRFKEGHEREADGAHVGRLVQVRVVPLPLRPRGYGRREAYRPLGGPNTVLEADETYDGGKPKNCAFRAPAAKKAVVALVTREGEARSFHVANVNAKTLRPLIVTNVDRASHMMTDESMVYTRVGREFAGHSTVNHSASQYVTTDGFKHSNTVETSFRSSSAV